MDLEIVVGVVIALAVFVFLLWKLRPQNQHADNTDSPPEKPSRAPERPRSGAAPKAAARQQQAAPEASETATQPGKRISQPPPTPADATRGTPSTHPSAPPAKRPSAPAAGTNGKSDRERSSAEASAATPPGQDREALSVERKKALRRGLQTTRGGFVAKLGDLLRGKREIDATLLSQIEEVLLTADVGVQFTDKLIRGLKESLSGKELGDPEVVWAFLRDQALAVVGTDVAPFAPERAKPFVIMVIGVNGVGKTTTIAKLASRYVKEGRKVVLAAGDTFRAAAVRQLEMWGSRVGAEVVKKDKAGADPSAVAFDAVQRGIAVGADIVIADTAGRLHTKTPLMEELKKVGRVLGKALDGAPHEVLLVLDANTGQNANQQVRQFKEALDVTGIVLTKLDGTAKGGVILGICEEHGLPIRFVGIGEKDDDLRPFDPQDFVDVLFERPGTEEESAA